MIRAFGVRLELAGISYSVAQVARCVALGLIVEVLRRRVAALAAGASRRARAHRPSPNSTTATKLLPLVPCIRFVPGYVRAPNDASDPHVAGREPHRNARLAIVELLARCCRRCAGSG